MNCHAARAVLDLHAEGRLTSRRARSVEAHLSSCANCRALVERPTAAPARAAGSDFKARLAATMKAASQPAAARAESVDLPLWPRDLSAVAFAAALLAVISGLIGWSGVPAQRWPDGDEIAVGRMP
ncbi:MAG: zf-HC2 domain-containing protein [Elusimicrobia bacterium]|nr:zf-HC2 domain-containing protein [Elusimicrobiota bacterium]